MYALRKLLARFILASVFIFNGLIGVLLAHPSYKKVDNLKTWTVVTATVISSSISQEHRRKGITFCPVINVKYVFGEQTLSSKLEIEDGPCSLIKASVQKTIAKFKNGKSVDAFVNPSKPSEILISNFSLGILFYLGVILIAISSITAITILLLPSKRMFVEKTA